MERTTRDTRTILHALRRHLGQRTVLCIAIPILREHIASIKRGVKPLGLAEREIVRAFRELTEQFGASDYHPTYVQRRLGPKGFLELKGMNYRLRSRLLRGVEVSMLESLDAELIASLKAALERRQAMIRQLEEAVMLPSEQIDARHELVQRYLSQLTGNRGEVFEVVSFAVLREYFRTFGFTLQRFSTTHANDGGMDFVGGEAIYQVTVDESVNKVRKDLGKAPGTKRVLVRPTVNEEVMRLCDGDVLETIELKDLLQHFISWLLARDNRGKQARHLQQVLQIALAEFRREDKAEGQIA